MPEGVHDQTKATVFPKNPPREIRPYRYLTIRPDARERVHLVRERVRCGKPGCGCARGPKHGPYWYLRYQYWDAAAERDRYAREYVPRSELPRVRRWIRRAREDTAFGWGQAGLLRRVFASVEKARLKRADTNTAQSAANAAEPAGGARAGKSPASRRRLRPLRDEVKPRRRREPVGPALRTLPAVSQATVPLETAAKPRTADYAYYVSRGVLRGPLPDQPDSGMRRAASYAVRIRTRTRP